MARTRNLGAHVKAQHKPREMRTGVEHHRDPTVFKLVSSAPLCGVAYRLEKVQKRLVRRKAEAA